MMNLLKFLFKTRKEAPRAKNGQYLRKVPIRQYGKTVEYLYLSPRREGVRFVGE